MWGEIINGLIQAGGQVAGSAVEGSFKTKQAEIAAQGGNTAAYIYGAAQGNVAQWGSVGGGYGVSQVLAAQLGQRYQAEAAIAKAKADADSQKMQTLIIVGVLAAAAIVGVLIYFNRK